MRKRTVAVASEFQGFVLPVENETDLYKTAI